MGSNWNEAVCNIERLDGRLIWVGEVKEDKCVELRVNILFPPISPHRRRPIIFDPLISSKVIVVLPTSFSLLCYNRHHGFRRAHGQGDL